MNSKRKSSIENDSDWLPRFSAYKTTSKRKSPASENDLEWLPRSKRICNDKSRVRPTLFAPSTSTAMQTAISKSNKNDKKFPFHKLIPELRNKIYGLVLDRYFNKTKKRGHRMNKELSYNAIPYTTSDSLDPKKKAPMNGMRSSKLPSFEKFLKSGNQQLHLEFASMRIARSELWLSPGVSQRDGVKPTFSHKGRQLAVMDRQYTEQITYAIM
jgi:hypothetical protein